MLYWGMWLSGEMLVVGGWLDWMASEVISNFGDSVKQHSLENRFQGAEVDKWEGLTSRGRKTGGAAILYTREKDPAMDNRAAGLPYKPASITTK